MDVVRQLKYITSQQLWLQQCYAADMNSVEINFVAPQNLNIKILMTQISGKEWTNSPSNNSYIMHGTSPDMIILNDDRNYEVADDHMTLVIGNDWKDRILLIGYQGKHYIFSFVLFHCYEICYVSRVGYFKYIIS